MEFSHLLSALQDPHLYPDCPRNVELVQTHISAIFLTGKHAYKIKKPVDFGFLDFTTLEKREYYCRQEVELNRRLSPEIYLGVVEIRTQKGQISLGEGPGEVIEYAVFMKQLPPDCTLDRWLARGAVTPSLLEKIAAKIAHFHARAATNPEIAAFGEIPTVRGNVEENFIQTEKYIGRALSPDTYRKIGEGTLSFLEHHFPLFQKRVAEGRIRDCHGDLHLQHICLAEEILIFDCIEFNQRFRYSDVAADLAFLLMDLDHYGEALFSADLAFHYLRISRDWPIFLLLNFYKSYRAYVRGKVTCFRLDDPVVSQAEKASALQEARSYFGLSLHYAQRLNRPALLILCGLMGTGKSTLALSLSGALGWELLRSDVLRKELAQIPPQEHRYENFHRGIYSPESSRKTYEALLDRAFSLLISGRSVILDASFQKQAERQKARDQAQKAGADFLLIECLCAEEELRRRLDHRAVEKNEPSDGRWELFADQKQEYEKVEGFSVGHYLSLNTEPPPEDCLGQIFRHLLRRAGSELNERT